MKVSAVPSHTKHAVMGERRIALSVLNLGAKKEWLVNATPRPALPPGKDTRYPSCRGLGVSQCRCGWVRKFLPPTTIRTPDPPSRSESLYWLNDPGRFKTRYHKLMKMKEYVCSNRVLLCEMSYRFLVISLILRQISLCTVIRRNWLRLVWASLYSIDFVES